MSESPRFQPVRVRPATNLQQEELEEPAPSSEILLGSDGDGF
eukprot:CAMPEP_0203801886 /NCGR_PEP_ID=MMETSP0100_2-20121128/11667_1 /ASSEMBLY_ACC=CAM_ASM_000210 /TAXON_ID=96639 /ORGANISM=" , Strain NY0313808BC1" /LENGTH=41 /DNA_ID= /DNA_START= /DNA_END= /DNA_ORIENTATION=